MELTSKFYRNTHLCCAIGALSESLIAQAADPDPTNTALKWVGRCLMMFCTVAAVQYTKKMEIEKENEVYEMISNLGKDVAPDIKWKNNPLRY